MSWEERTNPQMGPCEIKKLFPHRKIVNEEILNKMTESLLYLINDCYLECTKNSETQTRKQTTQSIIWLIEWTGSSQTMRNKRAITNKQTKCLPLLWLKRMNQGKSGDYGDPERVAPQLTVYRRFLVGAIWEGVTWAKK